MLILAGRDQSNSASADNRPGIPPDNVSATSPGPGWAVVLRGNEGSPRATRRADALLIDYGSTPECA